MLFFPRGVNTNSFRSKPLQFFKRNIFILIDLHTIRIEDMLTFPLTEVAAQDLDHPAMLRILIPESLN